MDHTHLEPDQPAVAPACGRPWQMVAFVAFLAIAGFLLFTEHRAHLLGVLPWLLLLACPILHLLHHGHGGAHHPTGESGEGGKS